MTVFAVAGVAAVAMAAEALTTVSRARETETTITRASHLMDAIALWPREDLDRRLGQRRQGPFVLNLQRPSSELYAAVLIDSASGEVLLSTAIFRADTAHVRP